MCHAEATLAEPAGVAVKVKFTPFLLNADPRVAVKAHLAISVFAAGATINAERRLIITDLISATRHRRTSGHASIILTGLTWVAVIWIKTPVVLDARLIAADLSTEAINVP